MSALTFYSARDVADALGVSAKKVQLANNEQLFRNALRAHEEATKKHHVSGVRDGR